MLMVDAHVESYGPHAMAEQDLCIAVGEDLTKHYPGHPWMVGADLSAGTIAIRLGYELPPRLAPMGYLLHIATLMAPGGHQRVMQAGGEWLERLGLPRGPAASETLARAAENGLNTDASVLKSRH
jgi:hypothetical protein